MSSNPFDANYIAVNALLRKKLQEVHTLKELQLLVSDINMKQKSLFMLYDLCLKYKCSFPFSIKDLRLSEVSLAVIRNHIYWVKSNAKKEADKGEKPKRKPFKKNPKAKQPYVRIISTPMYS